MRTSIVVSNSPSRARGGGTYVYDLSRRLVERGHEVVVCTRGSWQRTRYATMDGGRVCRVPFSPSYLFHLRPHSFFLNRLLATMKGEFDVLHLHSPLIPVVKTSLPTVVTEHGTARGFIDNLALIDTYSLVLKPFRRMYVGIDRTVAQSAQCLTAVSQTTAREIRDWYETNEGGKSGSVGSKLA